MKKFLSILAMFAAVSVYAAVVVPFTPSNGGTFKLREGGKLTRVAAFSPVNNGTVTIKSIYSAPVYTNAVEVTRVTNVAYTVTYSNTYDHVVSTNVFRNLSFVDDPYITGISTNATVVATTNSWPVLKQTISVTNDVVTGTQTGYKLDKQLDNAVYLGPGENLIFTGTGVGGWVRLIFE